MSIFLDTQARRQQFVTTADGVRISVREWGNPNGRPILFVHGVLQSHLCFVRQYASPELAPYRLVAFDVRGHGESDKPDDAVFYSDQTRWAADIDAVIDGLRLDRPMLAGWSMGGRIMGQYLAVRGDKAISGLHFIASRPFADPAFGGPGPALPPASTGPGLAFDIASSTAFLRACFLSQPEPDDFAAMLAYNIVAWPRYSLFMKSWQPRVEETMAAQRAVRVPTLISHGTDDALILKAAAERHHELIPHSKLSVYEDCGHSPFWEASGRFNRELAEFAREVFPT
jgi:pimeloyl-ACP methyl ester carboxylesterase